MKSLLLICLTALVTNSGIKEGHKGFKTYYYFFDSHSRNRQDLIGKEYILYSKIKTIEGDQIYFEQLAAIWGKFVNRQCKNSYGCTSDVAWYETLDAAEKEFKKIEKTYSDTTKYIVEVLNPIICITEE